MGHCDDNGCIIGIPGCDIAKEQLRKNGDLDKDEDLPEPRRRQHRETRWLIWAIGVSLRITGDLSLVTKPGCKGSKSDIHILNVHPQDHDLIPKKFESIAWTHAKDGIAVEEVDVKVCFLKNIDEDIVSNTAPMTQQSNDDDDDENDDDDDRPADSNDMRNPLFGNATTISSQVITDAFDRQSTEFDKQLGVFSTANGNTEKSTEKGIKKMTDKLNELKLFWVRGKAIAPCINMLLNSMISYAPLLNSYPLEDMTELDVMVTKLVHTNCGCSKSDNKCEICVNKASHGMGIKSLTATHLVNVARELEVILNGNQLHSAMARGCFKSAMTPNPSGIEKCDLNMNCI